MGVLPKWTAKPFSSLMGLPNHFGTFPGWYGVPLAEKVKVMPLWLIVMMASIGEWLYWVFTLGQKQPEMRKADMEYLDRGYIFSIDKAKERLGYQPLVTIEEGVNRGVSWALEIEKQANSKE